MVRGSRIEQIQAVRHAIEIGINYFDTAASYGDGSSETNLGEVMKELRPKNVILATKVGLRPEDLGNIRNAVKESLKRSLGRLRRDSVDVFQLHSQIALKRDRVRSGSLGLEDVLGAGGVADVFDELRSQGLVRFCGFTGLGETEALHEIIASDRFDVVQTYFNLLNPSAGFPVPAGFVGNDFRLLMREASDKKMGVVVIRVLAGGALGGEAARQGHAAAETGILVEGADYGADSARASKLNFLIAGAIRSLAEAAIRFALMNREVSTVLVGFSNLNQIDEAASCSVKEPFPSTCMEKLRELWASDFGRKPVQG